MPNKHVVAVLGMPLRAAYCRQFLYGRPDGDSLVAIVPRRDVVVDLPTDVQLIFVPLKRSPFAVSVSRGVLRRRALEWMRGGSTLGLRAEHLVRVVLARLRSVKRRLTYDARPSAHRQTSQPETPWQEGKVLSTLTDIDMQNPIEVVAVFDVFALAEVLEFAESRDVEVVVR